MDAALCAQTDPELFFPVRDVDSTRAAKAVCSRCSVQGECLDFALADPALKGIWGGTTADERRKMRSSDP
ncbi:MAG TPA: WhiB family transcriptional regulator [Mycobacteriales bacterium]|jgi:WhiB family redox-sensing transcriptional regulator|nr:WhiB family transcriptional regulator [Mycobacteriales bacterium]